MKKNPLGCRTVWLNSSTTRWTTGRKLRIHTQQMTRAGIDSVRTQLRQRTSPLPKEATRCQNLRRKRRRTCTCYLFLKEEHPWFYFFSITASSTGFLSIRRVLFSPARESLHRYSFCPAVTCREQPWRRKYSRAGFCFFWELCSHVTRVL